MTARRLLWTLLAGAAMAASPAARAHPEPEAERAPFDYYVLALSWSPAFCESHPDDRAECKLGRGFVAHGLWPQYAGGGGPEHCASGAELDRATIDRTLSAMPDEHLIRHEWVVHGSCSGLSAHDYFADMIRAIGSLSIPPDFDGERPRHMTADEIAAQFRRANEKLTPRSMALRCKGGQFEEIRICLSPGLQPVACGRGVHSQCRQGTLQIRAAH